MSTLLVPIHVNTTAVSAAARHLGYRRRTGRKIAAAFKSAINAAIRRGLIERDGPEQIRRAR